jgi:hypothetical protein
MAYMPFYSLLASSAFGFALLIAICIGEARRVKQHWLGCDGSFSHHEAAAPEDASDIPYSGRRVSACAFLLPIGEEGQASDRGHAAGNGSGIGHIGRRAVLSAAITPPVGPAAWIDPSSRFFMRSHHHA